MSESKGKYRIWLGLLGVAPLVEEDDGVGFGAGADDGELAVRPAA